MTFKEESQDYYVIGDLTTVTTDGAIGDLTTALVSKGAITLCAAVVVSLLCYRLIK